MRIAVIGGGAAGFFGAIAAAEHNQAAEIVIFEAAHQPLAKVLISGGGRCNLTNNCLVPAELVKNYPSGNKELLGPFNRFQPRDTIIWFNKHGVRLKIESESRVFPVTDMSSTIVDCLLKTAEELKIKIRLGTKVESIKSVLSDNNHSQFEITLKNGKQEKFDRVLLATGSAPNGYHYAEKLGHKIVPPVPSLFSFQITDPRFKGLMGIGFENVKLTLIGGDKKKIEQSGPMLITHWGLSGPAVLKLSAWGARILYDNNYRATLIINFLPNYDDEKLYKEILAYKEQYGKRRVTNAELFPVPKRYWRRIVQLAGNDEETIWANLTKQAMTSIVTELLRARFNIRGKGVFKEEFVTCGGVALKEIDFKTMQSRICPGLYLAGEILDIDGITGGFNFQSAWTTGWIAGTNMAR
jgi:predicted Rossmann fold flavoprotein